MPLCGSTESELSLRRYYLLSWPGLEFGIDTMNCLIRAQGRIINSGMIYTTFNV